jgi:hypothetical protein
MEVNHFLDDVVQVLVQAYHQFFVLNHFQQLEFLVFGLVLQKDLVETFAGLFDEVIQLKIRVRVDLFLFEPHDFVVSFEGFFGDFDEKINRHNFEIVYFGVEKVQAFAHIKQFGDVNQGLGSWVLFNGVAYTFWAFALDSMDHNDSVKDLPPFGVLIWFGLFHFLSFQKNVGENSQHIFGFLDVFVKIFGQGFVHESDLGAVFDSLVIDAQNDGIDAEGGDEEGKKREESEFVEGFHEIDRK